MKNSYQFIVLFIFSLFVLGSCGSSDPLEERCGSNWNASASLEQEINNLTAAIALYSQEPTKENCEAYKDAYEEYIDVIEEWEDCYIYAGQQASFNQSIADARAAIEAIDCQ